MQDALVFTRTKHRADRLAKFLTERRVRAGRIHGNRSQKQRSEALDGFRSGRYRVLVATDIAARGLDIDSLPHVVNYDLPSVPGDYVHRIGRAGAAGEAVSLMSAEDRPLLAAIERLIGRRIEQRAVPGFGPGYRLSAGRHGKPSRPRAATGRERGAGPKPVAGAGQAAGRLAGRLPR
jgi:ATP-dependent RNA helicase RhlE